MSLTKLIPSLLVAALAVGFTAPRAEAQASLGNGLVINNISLTNPQLVNGVLTAASGTVSGTLGGAPFSTDLSNFRLQLLPIGGQDCSVLHLELAPIHLALLGLHADTSAICLDLTAIQGGGLLGDLLCGLTGDLGGLLGPGGLLDLSALNDLLGGLADLLTNVLGATAASPDAASQATPQSVCTGAVEVLELVLGPVNLNLLGLEVNLDNCDNGPVQVCVSATASEGLLGGLLAGLAGGGLLDNVGVLADLVSTITDALGNHTLTPRQTTHLTNRLVGQLSDRLADGALSDRDLAKVTKTIHQVLR